LSKLNTEITPEMGEYVRSVSLRELPILARLREETAPNPMSGMQVSPEQGQFLAFLARLTAARQTLEVGVFTGYSSLSVALALPEDGRIVACDVSEEWTSLARKYWREAGVEQKIELHLAPAIETLHRLIAQGRQNTFDFAFIDADKANYQAYFDAALELVRPGGLIVIDNVLWHGQVIDPAVQDEDTLAIRQFNQRLHHDDRVHITLVPIGDGLTVTDTNAVTPTVFQSLGGQPR
jgi:caffeoyl-CoA O-methyltransferase